MEKNMSFINLNIHWKNASPTIKKKQLCVTLATPQQNYQIELTLQLII